MTTAHTTRRFFAGAIGVLALFTAACGDDESTTTEAPATTQAPATTLAPETTAAPEETVAPETTEMAVMFEGELIGTFAIDAGDCTSGVVGSWFKMANPGGNATDGPFVPNADSGCTSDPNHSLLTPGADGGLVTGEAQVAPDPAFDATGNGLAAGIFLPVKFFNVDFAGAMDADGAAPTVMAADGVLTADLTAFTAYYGNGMFSQGGEATGTIDPMTGEYVLELSLIHI